MFRRNLYLALLVHIAAGSVGAISVQSFISKSDTDLWKATFSSAVKSPSDLPSAYFGAAGLKLLGEKAADSKVACDFVSSKHDATKLDHIFYASGTASVLDGCKVSIANAEKTLNDAIKDDSSTQDLFFAASALKNLGLKIDNAKLQAALTAATKKDNSAASLSYAFHAATLLTGQPTFPFLDRIEDAVAQADEVDSTYLQYEGGLSPTALVVSGIFSLCAKANKPPTIKPDDVVKFANYLLSRKSVQLVRPAYNLVQALTLLSSNQFHIPVSISLASAISVTASQPNVQIKVANVFGNTLPAALTVTLETAIQTSTSGVVLNKKPLTAVPGDSTKTLFQVNLLETKREKGFYKLFVSAQSTDKRLVGTQAEVSVKVLSDVSISGVELSVSDREQQQTANVLKLEHPKLHGSPIDADFHQKVSLKFSLKDKTTNTVVKVHQAFVLFAHTSGQKEEIVFVAEADSTKTYRFDVDLQKSAKEFDNLSGRYNVKLIVGDATIQNSFVWHLADVNLKFPSQERKAPAAADVTYQKKPEIKHQFREPEKRPPGVVSDAFTVLALLPLLILLVLWLRIGINISNFSFSLAAIGFQLGIAGIFGLYFLFWLKLNMFQTLKYLAFVSIFTIVTGNSVLRSLAEKRKAKAE